MGIGEAAACRLAGLDAAVAILDRDPPPGRKLPSPARRWQNARGILFLRCCNGRHSRRRNELRRGCV